MPSLEMSLGLRVRPKDNLVQNTKIIDESLLSMSSPAYKTSIKFTDTIKDVLKILVACITLPRQQLSVCRCNVQGHLSAHLAKLKYAMFIDEFDKLYCKFDMLDKLNCKLDELAKLRMSSMSWLSRG